MGNLLQAYLSKRIIKPNYEEIKDRPGGPVITISREVGCSGLELAYALAERLNKMKFSEEWKVLSKEIFHQSAVELNLHPEKVEKIFKQTDRTPFDEMLNAFNEKRYKTDKKIKKTVIDVIRTFSEDGFCIIVGRAGNIVAGDIKNSLHIRMVAPVENRILSLMQKNGFSRHESIKFIEKVEKERYTYRHAIMPKAKHDPEIFDITFNREKFTTGQIVDIIMEAIREKGILEDYMS